MLACATTPPKRQLFGVEAGMPDLERVSVLAAAYRSVMAAELMEGRIGCG